MTMAGQAVDKWWLKSYPPGMPADIDYRQYRSLPHMLEEAFGKYATRNAYACMGNFLTYAQLDALSGALGAWLQGIGLQKGSRVAIMLPNIFEYPVVIAAVLRAGYTVVNVNPLYTPRELAHLLQDSGAQAIFLLDQFAKTLEQAIAGTDIRHVVLAGMGEILGSVSAASDAAAQFPHSIRLAEALSAGAALTLLPDGAQHDDIAFLQYTGGTTGVSKGAQLTHRNIIANVLQCEAWMLPALQTLPPSQQIVFACALPLYHIFGLTACCLLGARTGAMNVLIPNARDIRGMIAQLQHHRINIFPAVNTLYNGMLNDPKLATLDFSGLKICSGGGMKVQQAVAEKWLALTGCPIVEAYGLSETSPLATCNPFTDSVYNGSIGLPVPSTEVAILDDDGNPVQAGQSGEIAIRGPQVMAGYWNSPDETAQVMTADGFFKTGDIGIMDPHGYVHIIDRKKDMILVSGFNVYPNEIETTVAAHPDVLECACVGVADKNAGEAIKLFVVRKNPGLTVQHLIDHCKSQLADYKRPKYIEFREDLPKTNVGKILRRALRDENTILKN